MLDVCLALAKRLLPAIVALALLAGPAAAHPEGSDVTVSAVLVAMFALADGSDEHGEGCPDEAAVLHCVAPGCAQSADMTQEPFPALRVSIQPLVAGGARLGTFRSRPVLQPPILTAGT
jgi:hypothetical protein